MGLRLASSRVLSLPVLEANPEANPQSVEPTTAPSPTWPPWTAALLFLLAALLVKAIAFALDPYPAFHFGDSGAYLATALIGWIPPDRSFTYGFILRVLTAGTHSLVAVVVVQSILSAVASAILGTLLLRVFASSFSVALCFTIVSAIEPLQLMEERFVMTEALATFGCAVFVALCFEFLRTCSGFLLLLISSLGVLLVSLRYSFLPLVIALSIVLPFLALAHAGAPARRRLLALLILSVASSQGLLSGYRHLFGGLAGTKPAYLSRDGEFLLADMAPIVSINDFPIPAERAHLRQLLTVPLRDFDARRLHRWVPGGLCQSVVAIAGGNEERANQLARKTALRSMKRDPGGVLRLGTLTYFRFFDPKWMRWALQLDQGDFVEPTEADTLMIQQSFGINPRDRRFGSLTKRWELRSAPWCAFLVLLPLVQVVDLLRSRRLYRERLLLLFMSSCILVAALIPVEIANPRYLIPLPWIGVLSFGAIVSGFRTRMC